MTLARFNLPASQLAWLVTFRWGMTTVRYARWPSALTIGGDTYLPLAAMTVAEGRREASVRDAPTLIEMPADADPAPMLMARRVSSMTVTVAVVDPSEPAPSPEVRHIGRVALARGGVRGRRGVVELTVAGPMADLEVALSLVAESRCSWVFGSYGCGVDLAAHQASATVETVSGAVVTFVTLSPDTANYWTLGSVNVDGQIISVRRHPGSGAQLELVEPAPPDWVGKTATLTPYCDGTEDTCRDRYANAERRLPLGERMPDYHVLLEQPSG